MTAEEPRCARCGCTPGEHHKLHCDGRDGNCMCSSGWAPPGTPLTALDEAFQAENAEYDAAKAAVAAENTCRAVEVPTESHGQVLVHVAGSADLTAEDKAMLGQLAEVVTAKVLAGSPHLGVIQELMLAYTAAARLIEEPAVKSRLRFAVQAARDALAGKATS